MRVLFTSHVEHYTIGMVQSLSKYVDIWVLSLSTPLREFPKQLGKPNINRQLVAPDIWKIGGALRVLALKVLPKVLFDITHTNTSNIGLLTGARDRLVVTEHGWPDPDLQHESAKLGYLKEMNALLALNEIGIPIVAISEFTANMLREKFGVKAHKVVYHGLLDQFKARNPRTLSKGIPVILWVSRLIPIKEPNVFLDALKILNDEYKMNFKAVIRGEGPLKDSMNCTIKRYGLSSKISFASRIPFGSLPGLYESASLLVHTSSCEAFGLCILEAMGMALPVIVPRYGGSYEVAGSAGISFEPHNASELAEKIYACLQDPEQYRNYSSKSLQRSEFFTWSKAAKEYLEIYNKLL
ncbi:MAG: glycosyltransferase family 4 protein [Methanomassiliicoccales archaeon]